MNIEQSTFEDWQIRCLRVVNLIHAARTTIESARTRDSDEMATAEVLGIAYKDADDLYGVLAEAQRRACQTAPA